MQDRVEYADAATSGVDTLLAIVYALLGLAVLTALFGIASTLSLSVHERTRELGLLRAVGQSRRQVRSMVRWESVLVSLLGTVGGLLLGVLLGWGLVRAVSGGSTPAAFAAPPLTLAVVLVAGGVAGVLAGSRPARLAARIDLLRAIATE